MLFSSKSDIIQSINTIDPAYEKLHNPDLYYLWLYGKDLIPGNPNFEYYISTHQLYLLKAFRKNREFTRLMRIYPGLHDLYNSTMDLISKMGY